MGKVLQSLVVVCLASCAGSQTTQKSAIGYRNELTAQSAVVASKATDAGFVCSGVTVDFEELVELFERYKLNLDVISLAEPRLAILTEIWSFPCLADRCNFVSSNKRNLSNWDIYGPIPAEMKALQTKKTSTLAFGGRDLYIRASW